MLDPIKIADKAINAVDDNIYSQEEIAEMHTRRLEIDANSDSWLAKAIRPIATILTGVVWAFILIASVYRGVPAEAMYSATGAFMTCVGFYFDARKREKIAKRKALAAVQIDKQRAKIERADARVERRLRRRQARRSN
jgi:hypothetical protein